MRGLHLHDETNGIGVAIVRKTCAGGVTEVTVLAKFVLARAREHLAGSAAYATESGRDRKAIGKLKDAVEALGRDEKGTGHEK